MYKRHLCRLIRSMKVESSESCPGEC
jgi:hypothetical protein